MKYKLSLISTALLTSVSFAAQAETSQSQQDENLDTINVVTELEKAKAAGNKQQEIANLGLLGRQLAFTSAIDVVNYDEKAFEDQQPRNVVDAISKVDSSVMNFGGETNTLQGIYVRGLQLDARQISVNGLAGLYSTYNSPTAGVSSAQLIKGASTAVSGMDPEGSAGAAMNVQTKRAADTPINKISFGWFGDSRLQETFDFGHRFGENNEWGIRVNGKYRDGDTPRDGYSERDRELAIGADYRGDKLRVGIDYMYTKRKTNGGRARVQDIQNFTYAIPSAPDGSINLNPSWIGQTTEDETIMGTFEYDLPYNMMISGGIGHMESRYYGSFGQITNLKQNGDFSVSGIRGIDYHTRTTSANLKLQGEFKTGPINHNWSIAFDQVVRERDFDQSACTNYSITGGSIYSPSFGTLTKNSSCTSTTSLTVDTQSTDEKLTARSLAVSDMLGFYNDEIRLTLGGRFQWIKQTNYNETVNNVKGQTVKYDEYRFSPMVTLAYVPNPNLVFYGNYLEDLEPGATDVTDTGDASMSKPVVSRQIELGVRKNWSDYVTTTLSIYQIRRPGVVPSRTGNSYKTKYTTLGLSAGDEQGEERNRGIEFNIYGQFFNGTLRPSFGITYNKGELIDYVTYALDKVSGTQVASPRIIYKGAVEWDTPFIKDLTLNAAIQYYGSSYQDATKKYKFSPYTTVDIGAKYVLRLSNKQTVTLRGSVENLFDKNYWQVQRGRYDRSFAVVGMPRTYWATVEYSF
ncbi:TonB-dependent siderophore receptor [Pasteurellaceae bacterium LIM206]|nr:TonB-dependent siderophore receptor [Pasteurellaceae bacterium LIM206]